MVHLDGGACRMKRRTMPTIREVLMAVIGIGWLGCSTYMVIDSISTRDTNSVRGVVLASRVIKDGGTSGQYLVPRVEYQYVVAAQRFRGIWLGLPENRRMANWTAARFAPGTNCAVFYNPATPSDASLEKRPTTLRMFLAMMPGLVGLVLLTAVIAYYVLRRVRASTGAQTAVESTH